MTDEQKAKKKYLIRMFNSLSEDIGLEEYESILWYEQRGYTTDEAKREVLHKYRQVLLRDDDIVDTIVRFDDIYDLFKAIDEVERVDEIIDEDERYYKEYIDYISGRFCGYDFTVDGKKLTEDPKGIVKEIREVYTAHTIVQGLVREREYKESQLRQYESLIDKPETKAEKLGHSITPYGFLDLPKTKVLSADSQVELIKLIANKGVPYAVAMFDYLGFIKYLEINHFKTQTQLCKEVSKWLGSDLTGRYVKGNLLTLNERTEENKERYTAYKHIENVAKDYETLK